MKCTWKDCNQDGIIDQRDKNNNVWATLCQFHHKIFDNSISNSDLKKILKNWILAQGGSKKATERIIKIKNKKNLK